MNERAGEKMSGQLQTGPRSSAARRHGRWMGLAAALLAAVAGCRAPSPHAAAPIPPAKAAAVLPDSPERGDVSYDWHGLLIAPFGSVLKDIPVALHEVLLFRDDAHAGDAGGAGDDAECYASDTPAPRFVGRVPEEYVLCFRQDRLARIQASVRLTAAEAPEIFAAACAGWLRKAAQTGTGPTGAAPNAGEPGVQAQSAGDCEGREGAIRFSAHLGEDGGRPDLPQTEGQPPESAQTILSINLDSSADL